MRLVACGGTFDKRYDPLLGELVFCNTQLPGIAARARLAVRLEIQELMQMDSLDMVPADRERIVAACEAAPEDAIVVVHGTDTMAETAAVLGARFGADGDKAIVLTGAMVPYAIAQSDALFNLGYACAAAQMLPSGVWIAMNGRCASLGQRPQGSRGRRLRTARAGLTKETPCTST